MTERGLYLQVGKSGAKSWLYRFMLNGRAREMGLVGTVRGNSL
ncbi:MAG: Arm DNA-binding domain-containing protein [Rhodospirillales bacterium]